MGLPPVVRVTTGLEFLGYRLSDEAELGGLANLGAMRYLDNPTVGLAGLGIEGYLGGRAAEIDVGGRAYFTVPSLLTGVGVDYSFQSRETDFVLKLDVPMRRGGIVGLGSSISLRWLPGRDQTVSLGLTVPIDDRDSGRTRPQSDYVAMDDREPTRVAAADVVSTDSTLLTLLDSLRVRARWVARVTQPFEEQGGGDARDAIAPALAALRAHMATVDADFPEGHTANEEIRVYHETLERAFSLAENPSVTPRETTERGRRIAANARRILLDDVLLPYDYLFGQLKKKDTLSGMIAVAQANFAKWSLASGQIDAERAARVFFVFQTLCDLMEENRAELRERWGDNRYVWLPLQYGLTAVEHDTQNELNEIIERATRQPFTGGNRVRYVINEEFQHEMARSVRLAEDYHVLWVHDVRGVDQEGDPDAIAYELVCHYLLALTERARAYDKSGRLPTYLILLDQHYYETNRSRLWMNLLQDPMRHRIDLPREFVNWESEIERLQDDLYLAVTESFALQVETSQFGEDWLRNRIRVQVNITNPADYSYYSLKVVGKLPIPDNNMRDHRKIVFYDVTEDDPYRGMAMFTGMGIGEHYTGATWEDRALMLQGPAALATKDAARFLLETQGFTADEMPFALRPRVKPPSYDAAIAAELASKREYAAGRVIELHNETGFTPKPLNVAKAILYSLMPPGSVLKAPDSLWQSYAYASLMAGSALRGCRVLVIAPTLRSAPSSDGPQMARASGLMKRLVVFGQGMDDVIEREGGILRVGLYCPKQGVGDIAGRVQQALHASGTWDDRVYNFSASFDSVAMNVRQILGDIDYAPSYLATKDSLESPKLHLKGNFFASAPAWDDLMARPEWGDILEEYIQYVARQQLDHDVTDPSARKVRPVPDELLHKVRALLDTFFASMTAAQRDSVILYLTLGSANMDYRTQVMNGEVMVTIAGVESLVGVMDFILLAGLCEWPETPEQVDALIPPPGWFMRSLAGFIKIAL